MRAISLQHPRSDEQSLLQQFSGGNSQVFGYLWQAYRNYLYERCLYWMGGHADRASEALGIVLLRAWDKLPKQAEKITDFKAWLTRVTDDICIDINQKQKNKNGRTDARSGEVGDDFSESSPLDRDIALYICAAIDRLPDGLREPFVCHYYYQKECGEIASELSLSGNTVRERLRRARNIFDQEMQRYFLRSNSSEEKERAETVEKFLPKKKESSKPFLSLSWSNFNLFGSKPNLSF